MVHAVTAKNQELADEIAKIKDEMEILRRGDEELRQNGENLRKDCENLRRDNEILRHDYENLGSRFQKYLHKREETEPRHTKDERMIYLDAAATQKS